MEKGSLKSTVFLTKIQLSQVKNSNKRSSVKIMKKFLSDKIEEQQFQKMQNKEYNKSIENLLIDELHKSMSPFFDSINTNVLIEHIYIQQEIKSNQNCIYINIVVKSQSLLL